MEDKQKERRRLGIYFIDKKVGKSGLPIVKRKKPEIQIDASKNLVAGNSHSGKSAKINTSKPTKSAKHVPPFLIEPSLQFPGTETAEPVDLIIGFDMGTAWTKIVIQDTSRRKAIAIPFKEYGSTDNPFLLPTRVGLLDGHLTLCKRDDPHHICTDLKISLMEKSKQSLKMMAEKELTATGSELAATFVAIVLRYVRHWFIESQADIYRNNLLRWQLNLGIPVKNYDNKEIKKVFHNAALAGWWLSEQTGEITLNSSKAALQKAQKPNFRPGINRDYINVVPEVAAAVAGYAYSDLREEGLHLLVDIGATTLDVSTFILNKKDGEYHYGFLSAEIGRYGAFELHRSRLKAFRIFINSWLSKVDGISETLEPVPESYDHYVPPKSEIPNFDDDFITKAAIPITRVIAKTKKERDPNSKAWKDGLPLFLCGGGSLAKFYSEKLFYKVNNSLNNYDWNGFRSKQIPKPENLEAEGLRLHEYHRLAVAYGLSFQYEDIGIIIPPSEIDDIPPEQPKKGYEDKFISKDMV